MKALLIMTAIFCCIAHTATAADDARVAQLEERVKALTAEREAMDHQLADAKAQIEKLTTELSKVKGGGVADLFGELGDVPVTPAETLAVEVVRVDPVSTKPLEKMLKLASDQLRDSDKDLAIKKKDLDAWVALDNQAKTLDKEPPDAAEMTKRRQGFDAASKHHDELAKNIAAMNAALAEAGSAVVIIAKNDDRQLVKLIARGPQFESGRAMKAGVKYEVIGPTQEVDGQRYLHVQSVTEEEATVKVVPVKKTGTTTKTK